MWGWNWGRTNTHSFRSPCANIRERVGDSDMNANYCCCPLQSLCRKRWYRLSLSEVSWKSCFLCLGRRKIHIQSLKHVSGHLTHHRRHKMCNFPHMQTNTHTHTQWNLMECDLVWHQCTALICMRAIFTGIPRLIIIINPNWGIGTPNLTGLYGYSHSCRTDVTPYYSLSHTPCMSLIVENLRLMIWRNIISWWDYINHFWHI